VTGTYLCPTEAFAVALADLLDWPTSVVQTVFGWGVTTEAPPSYVATAYEYLTRTGE